MSHSRAVGRCTLLGLLQVASFASAETTIPVVDARTGRITESAAKAPPSPRVRSTPVPVSASFDRRVRSATVQLAAEGSEGAGYGSGTIVAHNGKEALVVTCGHIFRGTRDDTVRVTLFNNGEQKHLEGRVLSFDLDADVGIVSVPVVGDLTTIPVAEPDYVVKVGSTVNAAGCDKGGPPNSETTTIKDINLYQGPENVTVAATPPHGRSGGGLVSEDFKLIGVCNGIDTTTRDGIYAGLGSIHRELAKTRHLPVNRKVGQSPVASRSDVTSVPTPAQHSPSLSTPQGQVVEVIFVIDSNDPNSETKLIRLRDLSPALVKAVQEEIRHQPKAR